MYDEKTNMEQIRSYFGGELKSINYEGIIGVAAFVDVVYDLMPVQRDRLMEIVGGEGTRPNGWRVHGVYRHSLP